jgi:hypothetical protein
MSGLTSEHLAWLGRWLHGRLLVQIEVELALILTLWVIVGAPLTLASEQLVQIELQFALSLDVNI